MKNVIVYQSNGQRPAPGLRTCRIAPDGTLWLCVDEKLERFVEMKLVEVPDDVSEAPTLQGGAIGYEVQA